LYKYTFTTELWCGYNFNSWIVSNTKKPDFEELPQNPVSKKYILKII